jgi:signal transduction histidine kinase
MFADEMGQVVLDLLLNAIDAIKAKERENGQTGHIEVITTTDNNSVLLQVKDNGAGMSKAVQERIYEPFFTTKEVGSGSGQGMAIVYDVVKNKHGGTIDCSSEPNEGAVLSIRLPLEYRVAGEEETLPGA